MVRNGYIYHLLTNFYRLPQIHQKNQKNRVITTINNGYFNQYLWVEKLWLFLKVNIIKNVESFLSKK